MFNNFGSYKIGVSFRGGAAKGLGGIGLVKYFQENNVKPYIVGGSSIGAIIAALFSLGFGWRKMTGLLTHIHLRNFLSLSSILHKGTFLSKQKFRKKILEYTGSAYIEDLPIKTIIFATDPIVGERVSITKGRLVDAIMASSAYPVLMSPVKIHGQSLVDGDFFPSYSATTFRKIGAKTVFGVGSNFTAHLEDLDSNVIEQMRNTYNILMRNYEHNLDKDDPVDIQVNYDADDVHRFNFEMGEILVDRVYNQMNHNRKVKTFVKNCQKEFTAKEQNQL